MEALIYDMNQPLDQPKQTYWDEFFLPDEMSEKKLLQLNRQKGRAVIPFFGARVSCGLFGISDDYIEKYQSLDSRFIKNKASTFFFEAASDSMKPLIWEGDILIVDRSIEPVHKRVAVLSLNGEMICKRIMRTGSGVLLKSENPAYCDIHVTDEMNMIVFGVVTATARTII